MNRIFFQAMVGAVVITIVVILIAIVGAVLAAIWPLLLIGALVFGGIMVFGRKSSTR